jgi:hypothetical protein
MRYPLVLTFILLVTSPVFAQNTERASLKGHQSVGVVAFSIRFGLRTLI